MNFVPQYIHGLYVVETAPIADSRGFFERLFCVREFNAVGHGKEIVQINHTLTKGRGAIRGMHFQRPPRAEIKIIRCIKGSVFDVAVDIRKNSPTFLKWHAEILSAGNWKMMYIPEGFAHGFQTLEEDCELLYFHSEFYDKNHEGALRYDDPSINITWPLPVGELSERDRAHPLLDNTFAGITL
ncbi:MAG: dTDP-4-dehydrorhamnose 3,5-epimerase [Spirochaetes bacterium]|nr:dTDP-4-dehydrorhamnose 3,5-epimerase [Spirochaetota bacterium]